MRDLIKKLYNFLDNPPQVSFGTLGIVVLVVTLLRTYLENYSNPEPIGGFTSPYILWGYFLYYIAVTLSIAIPVSLVAKEKVRNIITLLVLSSPIILIAPVVDLIATGGACMSYSALRGTSLIYSFVTYFGSLPKNCGITIGLRVEDALIIFGIGSYIWRRTQSFRRTVAGMLGSYTAIFINLSITGIILTLVGEAGNVAKATEYFTPLFESSLLAKIHVFGPLAQDAFVRHINSFTVFISRIMWILGTTTGAILLFISSKRISKAILGNLRMVRILYYMGLTFVGALFAVKFGTAVIPITIPDVLAYIITLLSISFAWLSAVWINDATDTELDKISNPKRPVAKGIITESEAKEISLIFGFIALAGGFTVSYHVAILVACFLAAFWAHSAPPLRLKRFFLLGNIAIVGAGVFAMQAGYFLLEPTEKFADISGVLGLLTALVLVIFVNVKDFKDIAGDKAEGITTLPILIGPKAAAILIGISALIMFPVITILLAMPQVVTIIGALLGAAFALYATFAKPVMKEWPAFACFFIFIATIVVTSFF